MARRPLKKKTAATRSLFGELLRRHRDKLTQRELAEAVGVASNYIALLEAGRRSPSRSLALKLADEFSLEGEEKARFVAAALDLPFEAAAAVEDDHPAIASLRRFLAAKRGDPQVTDSLQDLVRELITAALNRGADRKQRSALKSTELLGTGYFHMLEGGTDQRPDTSHTRRQRQLEEGLLELIGAVTDTSVPITRRVSLIKELNQAAAERLGKDEDSAGKHTKKKPATKQSRGERS